MITLKSGNIALSRNDSIQIYNLRQLNFIISNVINENDEIKKLCLLQKITPVKDKGVRFVYQLFDENLLCEINTKIIRIKLNDGETNYKILSFIKLEYNEITTKIISLGKYFLVTLIEQNTV